MIIENEEWLQVAYETFEDAIDAHDYESAKVIIEDVRDVSRDAADSMQQELLETPLSKFAVSLDVNHL